MFTWDCLTLHGVCAHSCVYLCLCVYVRARVLCVHICVYVRERVCVVLREGESRGGGGGGGGVFVGWGGGFFG